MPPEHSAESEATASFLTFSRGSRWVRRLAALLRRQRTRMAPGSATAGQGSRWWWVWAALAGILLSLTAVIAPVLLQTPRVVARAVASTPRALQIVAAPAPPTAVRPSASPIRRPALTATAALATEDLPVGVDRVDGWPTWWSDDGWVEPEAGSVSDDQATDRSDALADPTTTPNQATVEPKPTFQPTVQKVTEDGCCPGYLWAADSMRLLYYDRSPDGQSGTWSVHVETREVSLLSPYYGYFSPDRSLVAVPDRASRSVRLHSLATGKSWVLTDITGSLALSPSGRRIAAAVRLDRRPEQPTAPAGPVGWPPGQQSSLTLAPVELWVSDLKGKATRKVAVLRGARLQGWFPDESSLLVTWRPEGMAEMALARLDIETGQAIPLASAPRLISPRLSPDGRWVAFIAAFTGDPARDGLWVQRTVGNGRRHLDFWGSFNWTPDSSALLVIPRRPAGAASQIVWTVDPRAGPPVPLTNPEQTPFSVTNNDWQLSPDGKRIAFVSAQDHSLWVLRLRP